MIRYDRITVEDIRFILQVANDVADEYRDELRETGDDAFCKMVAKEIKKIVRHG